MSIVKRIMLLLLSIISVSLSACDNSRNIPNTPINVVYAEGATFDGIFYPMSNGIGRPENEIAVVIHVPTDDFSVINSTLKVEYLDNERTEDAMINPHVSTEITAPLPSALDTNEATDSFWFRIPDSAALEYCDWIHYRWSFQYTRSDRPDPAVFIGQTRLIHLSDPTLPDGEGDSLSRTDECEAVP